MNLLVLDCDSTLSSIEGVDELARLRGPETFAAIENLTRRAMDGEIPLEEIFARRLELISPSAAECEAIGQLYIRTAAPGVREVLPVLRAAGWEVIILSGGYTQAIAPFAAWLGIAHVEAVPLRFDASGGYAGFDPAAPTARSGGKPDALRALRSTTPRVRVVMVGDGASDLEARAPGAADEFIACTVFVAREKVTAGADALLNDFTRLPELLG